MGENGQAKWGRKSWRRRAAIALAVFLGLLVIFHRPLLLSLGHRIAVHYAAKENLKLDLRLEGNLFTSLTARNLRAVSTGPSHVESIEADFVRVDYSLFSLIRNRSEFLRSVEARSARIVLNPAKKRLRPRPPKIRKKITLPDVFPEQVRLTDVTFIVRNKPHDFVAEHADLDLHPRNPGQLRIGTLQLVGGQKWINLSTQTSYANKNLFLREVVLADNERIRVLNVDASQMRKRKLTINIDYAIGDGKVSGSLALNETGASLNSEIHLRGENVAAEAFNKFAALPEGYIGGQIERMNIDGSGVLSAPSSWNGAIAGQINNFHEPLIALDRCVFQLTAQNGTATLSTAEVVQGENRFQFRGSAVLPAHVKQFGRSPATLEVTADALDLKRFTAGMAQKLSGSAQLKGRIDINNGKLDAQIDGTADSVAFKDGSIGKLNTNIKASKVMPPSDVKKPWYAGLQSTGTVNITNIRTRQYTADSVEGTIRSVDDLVTFERLSVRRKQNELALRGEYRLPANFADAAQQPVRVDLSFNAVELGDFWGLDARDKISGPLQISGQVEWNNGVGNGQLSIYGTNVRVRNLVFRQINAQYAIVNSVVYLNDFTASLNESDFVNASGIVDLRAPYHYSGKISANIADLATLKPLLRASGNQSELAGSFVLNWEGSGEAKTFKNSGKLKLALEKGRYATMQSLQAKVDASYSPDGLDVPIIFLGSDKMYFQAIAQAKGETLEITKIELDQAKSKYASGYVSIPFVWKNLGTSAPVLPANGKVRVTFQSENLDIKKLFDDLGKKPGTSGFVNVKLDAQGTLANLDARLDFQLRELRWVKLPSLEPATFDLTAQTQNNELAFTGKFQQPKIQPIELKAGLPFNLAKVIRDRKLSDQTTVNAKIQMPRSSMNFIRQLIPAIATVDGDLAFDIDVKGTIAQPEFSGAADITVNSAHFHNATLPALQNFNARVSFARDALSLERFGGELAGGPFNVAGGVTFPKLTEPTLDLQIKAESVLVARDDSVTARADVDVQVAGPLKSAKVTGNVAMTNSQFLKNIDLIPIGLPGRPPPQPTASRPTLSFPDPPVRDWTFDVTIKTKDPFQIRGNLANGGAIVDLHLTGTGLRPGLEGTVRLENVEATLPFSRLQIPSGFLYFDPSDPLNPRLDLHGTSLVRDYVVHVYVYGTSIAPEALFTSEPPLPQEEIISLLATGTTRQELTGSNNVLAGRAAMLFVQQLYQKVFKKGQPAKSSSIFDRLDVDFGTVDPRTGQQQGSARLRVNENFVLMGDVGVGGEFRGMVKYLIRFH